MKDFLIIGNLNAVTYKQVFPLIKDGQVGLGVSNVKTFTMPSEEYYENGQLKVRCTYKDGELDGQYEYYFENGQLEAKGTYKNGKLVSIEL